MAAYKKYFSFIVLLITTVLLTFIIFNDIFEIRNSEIEQLKNEIVALNEDKQSLIAALIKATETYSVNEIIYDDRVEIFQFKGLVEVREVDSKLVVDLIYATEKNFTKQVLYNLEICLLNKSTAEKLAAANAEFALKGYRLKVWDAFRPKSAQELMWKHTPNKKYVADPKEGSNHNRGASVDVTLVDQYGNELMMPTGFDDFTEAASRNYLHMPEEARENMEYLTEVMVRNGFTPIHSEWWHFNDTDYKSYPFLDLTLEEWANSYISYK